MRTRSGKGRTTALMVMIPSSIVHWARMVTPLITLQSLSWTRMERRRLMGCHRKTTFHSRNLNQLRSQS